MSLTIVSKPPEKHPNVLPAAAAAEQDLNSRNSGVGTVASDQVGSPTPHAQAHYH